MNHPATTGSDRSGSTSWKRWRRALASVFVVITTIWLGGLIAAFAAHLVRDCSLTEIAGLPVDLGLAAAGVAYLFASFEKVLKIGYTFRDYLANPDKKVALYPDCVALAMIVAYLGLVYEAHDGRKNCASKAEVTPVASLPEIYLTRKHPSDTRPLEWVPFFFSDLAATESDPKKGTSLSKLQQENLTTLINSLRACVGEREGHNVVLEIRGYADTNEFESKSVEESVEENRKVANRRASNLHEEISKRLGNQPGPARIVLNPPHQWPESDPAAMTADRYFETRPLVKTGQNRDQGLFNRRADLLILDLGECDRYQRK